MIQYCIYYYWQRWRGKEFGIDQERDKIDISGRGEGEGWSGRNNNSKNNNIKWE